MTTFRTAILLTIALTLSAAAHSQASAPSKQERPSPARGSQKATRDVPSGVRNAEVDRLVLKAMIDAFSINKASPLFFAARTDCNEQLPSPPPPPGAPDPNCDNVVKVTEFFNSTGDVVACSVSTGDIKIYYGGPPRAKEVQINWKLEYPSGQKAKDYMFEDKVGVLILQNDNGAVGNKADKFSKDQISLYHHWKKKDDQIYFYPLVIQTLPDNTVTLCGATDPRITND